MTRTPAIIALVASCAVAPVFGQAAPCSWDQCALRLQFRTFSTRVVQGASATPVGRLGIFAPRIEPLATGPDTARFHYEAYRSAQIAGSFAVLLGTVAVLGSATVAFANAYNNSNENEAASTVLFGAGLVIAFVGAASTRRAQDHLQRAIWLYNRSLAGGGGP